MIPDYSKYSIPALRNERDLLKARKAILSGDNRFPNAKGDLKETKARIAALDAEVERRLQAYRAELTQ